MRSLLWAIVISMFAFGFVSCVKTAHQHGDDEEIHWNKPSPEQLRQICPF